MKSRGVGGSVAAAEPRREKGRRWALGAATRGLGGGVGRGFGSYSKMRNKA